MKRADELLFFLIGQCSWLYGSARRLLIVPLVFAPARGFVAFRNVITQFPFAFLVGILIITRSAIQYDPMLVVIISFSRVNPVAQATPIALNSSP